MASPTWQFWIDVGGTFTDCFAVRPDGSLARHKLLSSGATGGAAGAGSSAGRIIDPARKNDPPDFWRGCRLRLLNDRGEAVAAAEVAAFDKASGTLVAASPLAASPRPGQSYELSSGEEAPIAGMRYLLGLPPGAPFPHCVVRLGTTRGTNALITRRGAATALVTTRGFGDILHIGYQNRPRLFELAVRKRVPLFAAVVEIDERMAASGEVLRGPDPAAVRESLLELRRRGIESLAVCLLNAYADGRHEELVGRVAGEVGFHEVSLSSRVAPLIKLVSRGDTTVVDAYLNPVLRQYVARLQGALGKERGELKILTSAGGLVAADRFVGKDSILSGPAGGVVGFSRAAAAAGYARAIGFDMGGTSTDVSRFDGRFELEYETEKAGVRVVAPMMAIETVAAGGGSICRFDGAKLVVGPDSAGADPGPACYGRGGPLAVTDANLFLGRIVPAHFPFPLDRRAVERRLAELADEVAAATGRRHAPVELADGLVRVANANMAQAIRSISIAKGYDPRQYVLVAFGGAAAQHACAVADELRIERILSHPDAGLLSAYGIGLADVVRHAAAGVYRAYDENAVVELETTFARLEDQARSEVLREGVAAERIELRRALDLRYRGQDAFLTVPRPEEGTFAEAHAAEHARLYGYVHEGRPLEIVAARVEAVGRSAARLDPSRRAEARRAVAPPSTTSAFFAAQQHETPLYLRGELAPGDAFAGPAIVVERNSTTIVESGWEAEMLTGGELVLRRKAYAGRDAEGGTADPEDRTARPEPRTPDDGSAEPDPVLLEIFNNHFAAIAEQMGITLRNTAMSVNVKERLDFSCAVFTPAGDLVVNAPHIPVHLGAMSETVKRTVSDNPAIRPGDVFLTNDPYRGGSHLPDVTVVTPVHDDGGGLLFFTASRAHHAEIGGMVPGSMPPFSRNLAEEGVLLRNVKVVDAGRSRMDDLRDMLLAGAYPTRAVEENLADIAAQIAANKQGARDLGRLAGEHGLKVVTAYMGHIQAAAEAKVRAALAKRPDGRSTFVDHLDGGSPIAVAITKTGDRAVIDFTGTGPVVAGNLNANRAIVTAAVMYCLRLLIDEDIPLNQGVMAPVEIVLPECLLNPPERPSAAECAAVVGGNVETSQRVVDVLLGALGLAAASQGTMNNLLFGDAGFGYYETICGGSGATRDADGADAVHTHMTNTRITDPEVLERRYPVRVHAFAIRRGSGGQGARRGGDGTIRRIEFLRRLEVSILSQRRGPYPPYGLQGGQPGALGRNELIRADGTRQELGALAQFTAMPGDVLVIETPGGGGFAPRDRSVFLL